MLYIVHIMFYCKKKCYINQMNIKTRCCKNYSQEQGRINGESGHGFPWYDHNRRMNVEITEEGWYYKRVRKRKRQKLQLKWYQDRRTSQSHSSVLFCGLVSFNFTTVVLSSDLSNQRIITSRNSLLFVPFSFLYPSIDSILVPFWRQSVRYFHY